MWPRTIDSTEETDHVRVRQSLGAALVVLDRHLEQLIVDEAEDNRRNRIVVGGIVAARVTRPPRQLFQQRGACVQRLDVSWRGTSLRNDIPGAGTEPELSIRARISSLERPRGGKNEHSDGHEVSRASTHNDQL